MQLFILVVILILVLLITLFLVGRWLGNRMKAAAQEVEENYSGEGILRMEGANLLGRKSLGMSQIRGNGVLALTNSRLVFRMLLPRRIFEIHLDSIENMEHPMTFLGKTKGMRLLVVNYTNEEEEPDAMGWAAKDPDGWAEDIRSAMQSRQS